MEAANEPITIINKSGISYLNAFNQTNNDNYQFKRPPSAPVYRPTVEEFTLGPLNYISKIRNEAEKYGICRIIPPSTFQPPFAVDVDNFRFTPRIQRLNELEAQTRVRLSFLEKLIKYWDFQNHQIKIPSIDKKILDLYQLHKHVEQEGGFDRCVKDRKWGSIANKMGFQSNTPQNKGTIASLLRHHYEKILFPYDLFVNGATYSESGVEELKEKLNQESNGQDSEIKIEIKIENDIDKQEDMKNDIESSNNETEKMDVDSLQNDKSTPTRRTSSRRLQGQSLCNIKIPNNKELSRLQVYSPGPRMSGFSSADSDESPENKNRTSSLPHCVQCGDSNNQYQLVTCSTCRNQFHIKCLIPPLNEVPKNLWNCPRCIAYLIQTQPQSYIQEFGFAQSQRTYSISEFGEIADKFKSDYFNLPAVPVELIEKEFWRLVSSMEDAVAVEYGADLHTNQGTSGFPTIKNPRLLKSDYEYVEHPWNLNNLPVLEGSVFKYINSAIDGMVVPWNYIGMLFSTFCWHNEDHWSYSVNYLHYGEPKFWYGVPGDKAELLEEAMKSVAPELFKLQPDLLHQLVTICNPNVLEKLGVPIYTVEQEAGDFVVTFPRAYHAGFNCGLNFAEAVNFASEDWLTIGRKCIESYSQLKRCPVFSHDELVCKMANDPDILDISIAEATYLDLIEMIENEKKARERVLQLGIMKSARETFELLPDDERQCDYCKTTCFLSGINCECSDCKLVCLQHAEKLCLKCDFEDMTLRYRYTLDELPLMLNKMEKRKNEYKEWSDKLDNFFQLNSSNINNNNHDNSTTTIDKASLEEFRRHLNEAKLRNYPKDTLQFTRLKEAIEHANKLSKTAKEILEQQKTLDDLNEQIAKSNRLKNDLRRVYQKPVKKRADENSSVVLRSASKSKKSKDQDEENTKLDFDEFKQFIDEINQLPCQLPETDLINQLHNRCDTIKKSIEEITNYTKEESSDLSSDFIEQLIFEANCISIVDFDQQLDIVKYKLDEIKWIEECKQFLNTQDDNRKKKHQIELSILDTMIESSKELLVSTSISQKLILQLHQLKEQAENWIVKAKDLIDLPVQLDDSNNEFDVELYEKLPLYGEFQILVKEAEQDPDLVKTNLNPYLDKLQKIITNADDWLESYKNLFPDEMNEQENQSPFFDQIEDLFNTGKMLGCKINQMLKLYSIYVTFKNWREKLHKLFIKKNSIYTLFNILLPRTKNSVPSSVDLVNMSSKNLYQALKKIYFQQNVKDSKIDWFKKQLDAKMSRESIEKAYKDAIRSEEICMKEIREKNLIKLYSSSTNQSDGIEKVSGAISASEKLTDLETEDDILDMNFDLRKKKFCLCGKKPSDWMIQCQLCQEYYHAKNCLKMVKRSNSNSQTSNTDNSTTVTTQQDLENSFFLCVLCGRSKRPSLDLVINLSEQLNNQKIRILENELLRCVIARANSFRSNLQKELSLRPDLKEAYNLVVKAFTGLLDNSNENDSSATATSKKPMKKAGQQQQNNLVKKLNGKINLTDQTKTVLHNLIWDSSLLQVTVNEFKYLWQICIINSEFKTSIFVPADKEFTLPIVNDYIKYKLNELEANAENGTASRKRKLDQTIGNQATSNQSTTNNTKSTKQEKKQKQLKKASNGKSKRDLNSSTNSSSSSESELCSLNENCLKPSNKAIDWVFCEGCESWLHFTCAGIDSSVNMNEIDKYYCTKCVEKDNSKQHVTVDNEMMVDKSNQSSLDNNQTNNNDQLANDKPTDELEAAKVILGLGYDISGLNVEQQETHHTSIE